MSIVVFELGAFRLVAKYVRQKKPGGVYYFRRRIPDDVRRLYSDKQSGVLFYSLKTKDPKEAARLANRDAVRQDALWKSHREGVTDYSPEQLLAAEELLRVHDLKPGDGHRKELEIALELFQDYLQQLAITYGAPSDGSEAVQNDTHWKEYLPPVPMAAGELLYGTKRVPFLSEALASFQLRRQEDLSSKAGKDRVRVIDQFIEGFGDRPIDQYSRQDANDFVAKLHERGNSSQTIRRRLNSIRPVFKDASRESEIPDRGIFESLLIPEQPEDSKERLPFTVAEIRMIQKGCREKDDDLRWIVAILSDTGARLAEVIGLQRRDVVLDGPVPHIKIRPNQARSLKTTSSVREVPLVGASLWGASRAFEIARGDFLFPRYIDLSSTPPTNKATHASNTLVKWIKTFPLADKDRKVPHSFRHSLRDRLRAVETPKEIADALGGWKAKSVGEGYGKGYPLEVLFNYLNMIVLKAD